MGDLGKERGAPTMEDTEGEDIWKDYTTHTVIIFSPAQLLFFAASSAQGESMSGQSSWISFARGMEMIQLNSSAVNKFLCEFFSLKSQEVGELGPERIVDQ